MIASIKMIGVGGGRDLVLAPDPGLAQDLMRGGEVIRISKIY
jgi:hypothetical protein